MPILLGPLPHFVTPVDLHGLGCYRDDNTSSKSAVLATLGRGVRTYVLCQYHAQGIGSKLISIGDFQPRMDVRVIIGWASLQFAFEPVVARASIT